MNKFVRAIVLTAALTLCLSISASGASAQWSGYYNYSGAWAGGGVSTSNGPYGWGHSGLGYAGLGYNHKQYGMGLVTGVGPTGGGVVGVRIPTAGTYTLQW